jgi:hypothetical protein
MAEEAPEELTAELRAFLKGEGDNSGTRPGQ